MDTIVSAVIGGLFSLIGVWLGNYLQEQRQRRQTDKIASNNPPALQQEARTTAQTTPRVAALIIRIFKPAAPIKSGVFLIVGDLFFIVIVVSAFNLNNQHPWWDNYFAALSIGAIPILAVWFIIRGIGQWLARARRALN